MMNSWKRIAQLLLFGTLWSAASASAQVGQVGPYYAMPAWSQTLPPATRFVLLANFNNRAFLDRNTGLVWAREALKWESGNVAAANEFACQADAFGGQWGWRLSTWRELLTLFVPFADTADDPIYSRYGTQIQTSVVRYPPIPADGFTQIIAARSGTTFRYMENQTETDWNIYQGAQGSDELSNPYVWCVRGLGGNP